MSVVYVWWDAAGPFNMKPNQNVINTVFQRSSKGCRVTLYVVGTTSMWVSMTNSHQADPHCLGPAREQNPNEGQDVTVNCYLLNAGHRMFH